MAKGKPIDRERAIKWAARAVEWQRLSVRSTNDHVTDICAKFAQWSMDMADFWDGR